MDKPLPHRIVFAAGELDRSKRFYREVLELEEIERPVFPYDGAWYRLGTSQLLHISLRSNEDLHVGEGVSGFDGYLGLRVKSYRETLAWLHTKGFREEAPENDLKKMVLKSDFVTGQAQIYILDPDRNVIEFNCKTMD